MILKGITGLCGSTKGTLSLLIVVVAAVLTFMGKLDSVSFAAVIATVQAIFCWTRMKTDTHMGPQ